MVDKKNEPKYSMGGKYEGTSAERNTSNSPGPNSYNIPSKMVEKQGKTFGIKLKGSMDAMGNVPGPGQYEQDKFKKGNY